MFIGFYAELSKNVLFSVNQGIYKQKEFSIK